MQAKIDEKTCEVSIHFKENELRLAIWSIEALACTLEESGFNTEKMWEFAKQLRGLNADRNNQPLFCDINGN